MKNVLDLRQHSPEPAPDPLTVALASAAPVVEATEAFSEETPAPDEVLSEPETEAVEAVERDDEPAEEDLAEAVLASALLPAGVSWTAQHPLQGAARQRHHLVSAGLIVLAALISLWTGSVATLIAVAVGVGVLELREHLGHETSVAVDEEGLEIDGQRYAHEVFASFHIHRMPDDTHELSLKSEHNRLPSNLRLPLGDQDPYELHTVLAQYIPEGRHRIPFTDYFIRKPRS